MYFSIDRKMKTQIFILVLLFTTAGVTYYFNKTIDFTDIENLDRIFIKYWDKTRVVNFRIQKTGLYFAYSSLSIYLISILSFITLFRKIRESMSGMSIYIRNKIWFGFNILVMIGFIFLIIKQDVSYLDSGNNIMILEIYSKYTAYLVALNLYIFLYVFIVEYINETVKIFSTILYAITLILFVALQMYYALTFFAFILFTISVFGLIGILIYEYDTEFY